MVMWRWCGVRNQLPVVEITVVNEEHDLWKYKSLRGKYEVHVDYAYPVKDQLKSKGFKFHPVAKWWSKIVDEQELRSLLPFFETFTPHILINDHLKAVNPDWKRKYPLLAEIEERYSDPMVVGRILKQIKAAKQ